MIYILYDKRHGGIIKQIDTPTYVAAADEIQDPINEEIVEINNDGFIDDGKFRFDPANLQLVEKDDIPYFMNGNTIMNLPHNTAVELLGELYYVNDGMAELEFSEPGQYQVILSHIAFNETVVTINVN